MKKKLFAGIIALILMLVLVCPVQAEQVTFDQYVIDVASIFNEEEKAALAEQAEKLAEEYGCAVYCVTIDTLDGYEAWEYNEALQEQLGLGYGSEQSCVILLVSMEEREYDIMAHGYGNTAFTDYGKESLADYFLPSFSNDEWYEGFMIYLEYCESYLQQAAEGTPVDAGREGGKSPVLGILTGIGVPSVIAAIICSGFKNQMKTANLQTNATAYKAGKGLVLTKRSDTYTHTTREQKTKNSSAQERTTVNQSGSSHKGGNF